MSTSNGTIVEIELPCKLSTCDANLLQRCEGRVLFLPFVRARVLLKDVDYKSFYIAGTEPDTLSLLSTFKTRFAAVITRALPGRMSAVVLGMGSIPNGLALQNTGPFDLCNGDTVCLMPPIFPNVCCRIRLESIDTELLFPVTVPTRLANEILAKTLSRAIEAIGRGQMPPPTSRESETIMYNGRSYTISPTLHSLDAAESTVRTLLLNMIFAINEGNMILYTMIPTLLTLGASDGYINALVGLETATRAVGQLIRIPNPPPLQDAWRRYPVYEALSAWITMTLNLGNVLSLHPLLKVCTFDGPANIKAGDLCPVIANWY
ncbi:UL18 [Gallid alphaherpesvirus 2]|uniref:Triplex capsid protein 2 n=3 Tax=Gallid alphaherpesvirus 2 TaxID=10390 RepID=TRX2_GAHVM|nr:capsid triplex subunit 2 [Gallid alphaherpesvirus 2]Q9E6P9.1 RecName: Full=Triplex capsid protein 2 [Marek's disease herpesvirus type 1 strain MD5]ACF49526.1 UL18 [synthetic construct]AEV54997.1 UL18 [Gallid herpesvirus 2 strain 814]AAG14210.1 UL18 capsid protein-like protein [Gallid alphaherpesvirus 2]AAL37971.1 capsid protein [Gallid alphaherpesvirus 2]AAS01657.1 VP23 nucleocapsid protein [Gallid alphaherpesvirus 2]